MCCCLLVCGTQGILRERSGLNYQASSPFPDTRAAVCGVTCHHHVRKSVGVHPKGGEDDENCQNKQVLPILPCVWEMSQPFLQHPMRAACQRELSLCSPDTGPMWAFSLEAPQVRIRLCAVCFGLYLFSQPTENKASSYLKYILEVKHFSFWAQPFLHINRQAFSERTVKTSSEVTIFTH